MSFRLSPYPVVGMLVLMLIAMAASTVRADFFQDRSHLINNNGPRLSYGIAVADLDSNNSPEFIVTGFGHPNLALAFSDGAFQTAFQTAFLAIQNARPLALRHVMLMAMAWKKSIF